MGRYDELQKCAFKDEDKKEMWKIRREKTETIRRIVQDLQYNLSQFDVSMYQYQTDRLEIFIQNVVTGVDRMLEEIKHLREDGILK